MTTLQDRVKEFETRFKHDQELEFKVNTRRNRLLGLWAAERMGLPAEDAAVYAKSVVDAAFAGGTKAVVAKVTADLNAMGDGITADQAKFELDHFAVTARQQVMAT
jgi:hypothetical protein